MNGIDNVINSDEEANFKKMNLILDLKLLNFSYLIMTFHNCYHTTKGIARRALNNFFFKIFLIVMISTFDLMYGYSYLKQMTLSLDIDFGYTYHLMLMSIPSLLTVCYPPCVMIMEIALTFSMEFSALALKRWSQVFKKDIEIIKFKVTLNKDNPDILRKSK